MTEGAEPKPARVVVADDQTVVREGIVMLLGLLPGIEVVGAVRVRAWSCTAARQFRHLKW